MHCQVSNMTIFMNYTIILHTHVKVKLINKYKITKVNQIDLIDSTPFTQAFPDIIFRNGLDEPGLDLGWVLTPITIGTNQFNSDIHFDGIFPISILFFSRPHRPPYPFTIKNWIETRGSHKSDLQKHVRWSTRVNQHIHPNSLGVNYIASLTTTCHATA